MDSHPAQSSTSSGPKLPGTSRVSLQDQREISQALWSLGQLQYSGLESENDFTNRNKRQHSTHKELRLLNAISIALTSGNPGDVTAAALDKSGSNVVLVLSKNDPPTKAQKKAAEQLFSLITKDSTNDASDLFQFLISNCHLNMEKRVKRLHRSLSSDSSYLREFLSGYKPRSIEKEFSETAGAVEHEAKELVESDCWYALSTREQASQVSNKEFKHSYPSENTEDESKTQNTPLDITCFIFSLLVRCGQESALTFEQHTEANSDKMVSMERYAKLCLTTNLILGSRFLSALCKESSGAEQKRAAKLKRQMLKVLQYHTDLTKAIAYAKELFKDKIHYRWVDGKYPQSGEGKTTFVEFKRYLTHLQGMVNVKSRANIKDYIHDSDWAKDWKASVSPRIHAEIKIVLDLAPHVPGPHQESRQQMPIGCSKRSCLGCAIWMKHYNSTFKQPAEVMTSGSHGKPYAAWALPVVVGPVKDGRGILNALVLNDIKKHLKSTLESVAAGSWMPEAHISNDAVSSSLDSGESQGDDI